MPRSPSDDVSTHYAPNPDALARETYITDDDVLAVIDARGGRAYAASLDIGLANRFAFLDVSTRQHAVAHALRLGVIIRTPMGVLRRPPADDE